MIRQYEQLEVNILHPRHKQGRVGDKYLVKTFIDADQKTDERPPGQEGQFLGIKKPGLAGFMFYAK